MGPLFPGTALLERSLWVLLRTDFHLIRGLSAHFVDFRRELDVEMGKEKHNEGRVCIVSGGKYAFYRFVLGRRAVNILHNELSGQNCAGDRGWTDADRCTRGGYRLKPRGRGEDSGVHRILWGVWMFHQLVLWCFPWEAIRVYWAILFVRGRFSHIYYLSKLADWLYGKQGIVTIACEKYGTDRTLTNFKLIIIRQTDRD